MKIRISETLSFTDNKRVPSTKIGESKIEVLVLELYNLNLAKLGPSPMLVVSTKELTEEQSAGRNQSPTTEYKAFIGFEYEEKKFESFNLDFSWVDGDGTYSEEALEQLLKADLESKGLLTEDNQHLWNDVILYPTKRKTGIYRIIPGYLEKQFKDLTMQEKELALDVFIEIMRMDADTVYTRELSNASNALILTGHMPLFASYKRDAFKGFQMKIVDSLKQVSVKETIEGQEYLLTSKIETQQEIIYASIPIVEKAVRNERILHPDKQIRTFADYVRIKIREEF